MYLKPSDDVILTLTSLLLCLNLTGALSQHCNKLEKRKFNVNKHNETFSFSFTQWFCRMYLDKIDASHMDWQCDVSVSET